MTADGMQAGAVRVRRRAGPGWRLLLPVLSALAVAGLAIGFVAYALSPRWPEAAPAADAPHLPIVIAGETFHVPPAAIRQKVQALPERQRMAVVLHKYQQMDYRQIAEVLKLSESATKSLLFRAYETLREQLKEFV